MVPSRYAAYVGISGGTFSHVKEVIRRRNYLELTIINKVVVIIGGRRLSFILRDFVSDDAGIAV